MRFGKRNRVEGLIYVQTICVDCKEPDDNITNEILSKERPKDFLMVIGFSQRSHVAIFSLYIFYFLPQTHSR